MVNVLSFTIYHSPEFYMVEETQIQAGYQKTEVGIIPNDWSLEKIDALCDLSKKRINPLLSSNNFKCIELEHISQESGRLVGYAFSKDLKSQKTVFKKGDVLFGKLRPYLKKYLFANFDGVCTTEIWVLQSTSDILSNWLFYIVQSDRFLKAANQSEGTKMPRADWRKVRETLVPVPSTKAEQTAIATALNDADALITRLEKLIAKKRAVKQGTMQELLKAKNDWEVKKLGEIGSFKNGINKAGDDFGFGYPFVNLLDIFGKTKISNNAKLGLLNSNVAERKLYNLIEGDVVFIRSSVKPEGVGLTCLIENNLENTVFSGFIIRFRDNGFLSKEFKEYCFHTNNFRERLISSSTVSANTNINQEALKNLTVSFPKSKTEQTRIAEILSDMDAEIAALEKKLKKYKRLKIGMMQNLLTGKIRLISADICFQPH